MSSVRMVAGVCAVATGLLLGSNTAIAAAAPDSGSTSTQSTGGAQKQARPAVGKFGASRKAPTGNRGTKRLPTAASIAAVARAAPRAAFRPAPRAAFRAAPRAAFRAAPRASAVPDPVGSVSSSSGASPAPVAAATTSVPTPAAPSASSTQPLTPITDTIESLTTSITQIPALTAPVTNSIPVVSDLTAPATQAIEQIPVLLAPTFQVMAAVEGAMTSVANGAFPLAQQPADLAALLGASTHQVGTDLHHITAYPAASAEPLRVQPRTIIVDVPSSPESAEALTPRLLSNAVTLEAAPQTTAPARTQPGNWLQNLPAQIADAIREGLRNVSLTELALAALPGLAGLVVFFATGIGLGHRQAKFAFAMQTMSIIRFAPSGPLGVVRSGSFIAVRPKKTRPTPRHRPGTHSSPLDSAA